jgi:hypothetical protein
MTSVADINDNYRYARTLVGERLLALIIEDMSQDNIEVVAGEEGRQKKILLNVPQVDPEHGFPYRENDVSRVSLKIALSDVPSTPAYRQQQMVQMSEILKSLPPQLQAFLIPYYLETTDLPRRREMADLVRKQMGIQNEDERPDPEKQQLIGQLQQMQQLIEQGKAAFEAQIADLQGKLKDKSTELGIQATEAEASARLKDAQAAAIRNSEFGIGKPIGVQLRIPNSELVRRAWTRRLERPPSKLSIIATGDSNNIQGWTSEAQSNLRVQAHRERQEEGDERGEEAFCAAEGKKRGKPERPSRPPIYEFRITHSELRQRPPVAWTSEAQSGGSTFPALCAAKFTTVGLRFACPTRSTSTENIWLPIWAVSEEERIRLEPSSIRGNTTLVEFGMKLQASSASPWTIDLGIRGRKGQREGVTGKLRVEYAF